MADESEAPQNVSTPYGETQITRTIVDPVPQQISAVEEETLEQFRLLALHAESFAHAHGQTLNDSDLKILDVAFQSWRNTENSAYTDQQVMEILGAYLGEKLNRELRMEWVVVTDEYGTDYAVRGIDFEIMAFPFSSVWKRIEDGQHDFLYGVYHAVKNQLSDGEVKRRIRK